MLSAPDTYVGWCPATESDRDLVTRELDALLTSHHFRNSKRYPALLKYVVMRTLDGHADQLKERTLGVEVFGRPANYDTNLDPVVRISASEVRKRIAQFYRVEGREPQVEIGLPLGSYVPEFKLRVADRSAGVAMSEDESAPGGGTGRTSDRAHDDREPGTSAMAGLLRKPSAWVAACVLVIVAGGIFYHRLHAMTITERLFDPLIRGSGSVQIVIGNGLHDVRTPPDPEHEVLAAQLHGAYNRVSVCDTVAVSRLAATLGKQNKPYEIKEADLTNLQDLRERPAILIGAYNNLWTMRLMEPLRFHFVKDGHSVRLVDTKDPHNASWTVDYTIPTPSTLYDYAIVVRYQDPTTNGAVLIIAGIGAYGTQAASEAVTTPIELERIMAGLPRGWENSNVEMVLKTGIIHGEAGPAQLIGSATW